MHGFDDKTISIVYRLRERAELDAIEGADDAVFAMTLEAAEIIEHLQKEKTQTRNVRQSDILQWANATFGTATADNTRERIQRFIEEAIELAQAVGLDADAVKDLVNHVYAKPAGKIEQEIGQVGVSLLGLAEHLHISADDEERKEFDRIVSLPPEHWRSRQNAKAEKGLGLSSTKQK